MDLDRMIYLVISDHGDGDGPYFPEVRLADTSLVILTKDILQKQYTGVRHVLEICPAEKTCREVTDDFSEIIDRDPDHA
jgi:hypothetical protein